MGELNLAEIDKKYRELLVPRLQNLEDQINELIGAFEREWECVVIPEKPPIELVRECSKRLQLLSYHVPSVTYNLMVRHLGLNQDDYPIQRVF